jgi:hypothetical protein
MDFLNLGPNMPYYSTESTHCFALPIWPCPMPIRLCPYGPALTALPLRRSPYGPALTALPLQSCPYSPAHTALSLRPGPYSPALTVLPIQPCPYSPALTALPLQLFHGWLPERRVAWGRLPTRLDTPCHTGLLSRGTLRVRLLRYVTKKIYVTKKTPITPCGRPDPGWPIGRPGLASRRAYRYDPITTRDTFLIFSV